MTVWHVDGRAVLNTLRQPQYTKMCVASWDSKQRQVCAFYFWTLACSKFRTPLQPHVACTSVTCPANAQDLADKIASLNSAIDDVATQLKAKEVTTEIPDAEPVKVSGSTSVVA